MIFIYSRGFGFNPIKLQQNRISLYFLTEVLKIFCPGLLPLNEARYICFTKNYVFLRKLPAFQLQSQSFWLTKHHKTKTVYRQLFVFKYIGQAFWYRAYLFYNCKFQALVTNSFIMRDPPRTFRVLIVGILIGQEQALSSPCCSHIV